MSVNELVRSANVGNASALAACSIFKLEAVKNLHFETVYVEGELCHCQHQRKNINGLTKWSGHEKRCYEITHN